MAERFNLTAQLQIQTNQANINNVVTQVKRQLEPIGDVKLKLQADSRSLAKANKEVSSINKNVQQTNRYAGELNKTLVESARRFSVITVATGSLLSLVNAFKRSVKEAIAFEEELVRISQVTGKTVAQLSDLSGEVRRLSTTLGVSSSELLNTSRILLQTGLSAEKTKKALDILAKTTLAATFDNIQDTAEGAIAILNQFGDDAIKVGGDIKFLEQSLDAVNAVSKNFAVESADLISAIRRVGGVFSNAGGSVEELIALFTSVRQTTREGAETIATGLRTIFTRIQRQDTVDALKELNIQLQDSSGNFVGAFEAVKRLSEGLSGLDPRSFRFAAIVEELGGFRQIGKVIPLINQFTVAQDALNVAQNASGSISQDAQTAQQALAVEIRKTKEQFDELIASFTDSSAFRSIITGALKLAQSFIRVAETLEPILPLLTTLFALKAGQGLARGIGLLSNLGGGGGGRGGVYASKFAGGGKVLGFARGGVVPGQGNSDTVPAMLTPGEFVIKKASVKKLGADRLAAMNENRYQKGGNIDPSTVRKLVAEDRGSVAYKGRAVSGKEGVGKITGLSEELSLLDNGKEEIYGGAFLSPQGLSSGFKGFVSKSQIEKKLKATKSYKILSKAKKNTEVGKEAQQIFKEAQQQSDFRVITRSLSQGKSESIEDSIFSGVIDSVQNGAKQLNEATNIRGNTGGSAEISRILRSTNIDNVIGNIFEAILINAGSPYNPSSDKDAANDPFDFPIGLGGVAKNFSSDLSSIPTDAKTRYTTDNVKTFVTKARNFQAALLEGRLSSILDRPDVVNAILNSDSIIPKGATLSDARDLLRAKGAENKNRPLFRASGGNIPGKSDTVPALLTPGEFVFNKSAAQSIGYSNLNRMNKQGVQGFAKGGPVGVSKFAEGGSVTSRSVSGDINIGGLGELTSTIGDLTRNMQKDAKLLQKLEQEGEAFLTAQISAESELANLDTQYDKLAASASNGAKGNKALQRIAELRIKKEEEVLRLSDQASKNQKAQNAVSARLATAEEDRIKAIQQAQNIKSQSTAALQSGQQSSFTGTFGTPQANKGNFPALGAAALGPAQQSLGALGNTLGKVTTDAAFLGKNMNQAAGILASYGASQQATAAATKLYGELIKKGLSPKQAMENAVRKLTVEHNKNSQANSRASVEYLRAVDALAKENSLRGKLGAAIKKATGVYNSVKSGGSKVLGSTKEAIGAVGKSVQPAARATQSLQFFAAFGTSMADATGSALGLAEAQKKALTQTIATGTAFLFLASTVLDLISNFADFGSAAASTTDAVASAKSAAADDVASRSSLNLANTLGIASRAALANAQANTASTSSELAEASSNAAATASEAAETQANIASTATELQEAGANSISAASEGAKQMGKFASVASKATGPILAMIAVVSAVYLVMDYFAKEAKAVADELSNKTNDLITKSSEEGGVSQSELLSAASNEARARDEATGASDRRNYATGGALAGAAAAAAAGAAFGSAIPVIGTVIGGLVGAAAGLAIYYGTVQDNIEVQKQQKEALESSIKTFIDLNKATSAANKRLTDIENLPLTQEQKTQERIKAQSGLSGKQRKAFISSESELVGFGSILNKTAVELSRLSTDELVKLAEEAELSGSQIAQLKIAQATYNGSLQGLNQSVSETRKTLQGISNQEIRDFDFKAFKNGAKQTSAFGLALKADEQAIKDKATAQARQAQTSEEANKIIADANNLIKEQRSAYEGQQQSILANEASMRQEAAARLAILNTIREQEKTLNDINNANKRYVAQQEALNNRISVLGGGLSDVSIADTDTSTELPLDQLKKNLDGFITSIADLDPQLVASGKKAREGLEKSREIITKGFDEAVKLTDIKPNLTGGQIVKDLLKLDENDLKQALGGTQEALDNFKKKAQELAKDGIFSESDAKELFAPVVEANQKYSDIIQGLTQTAQQQLATAQAQLKYEQAVREKNIQSMEAYNSVVVSGAETLASATGGNPIEAKRVAQQRGLQRTLDTGIQSRGGVRLQAGNLQQLATAKKLAQANLERVTQDIEAAKAAKASKDTQADLIREQQQYQNTIKDANDALNKFTEDRGLKIQELNNKIQQEINIRQQAFSVLKEFVVGGEDARKQLQSGASGILSALQTGTTQNLSEDQRSQTFALLDKLSNVQIAGTGLTGEQISNELVFRDAVRLGFPPDIAKELATQSTTEEQMLDQLKMLVKLQQDAAGQVAGFSGGGVVQYRAGGGPIFKPRGTDTVPAMLTPGEFVIKKSAVDKIGVNNLAALNNGGDAVAKSMGGPIYRSIGGMINYLQGGGQPINFQNAGTNVLNGINVLDGAGFKGAFRSRVRGLDTDVLQSIIRSEAGGDAARAFRTLVNAGEFSYSRFLGTQVDSYAQFLDSLKDQSGKVFSRLDAGGALISREATYQNIRDWLGIYGNPPAGNGVMRKLLDTVGFGSLFSDYASLAGSLSGVLKKMDDAKAKTFSEIAGRQTQDISTVNQIGKTRVGRQNDRTAQAFDFLRKKGLYLNRGGRVNYLSDGGHPSDTVPAMLTPGEFVMTPEAVQKYGVGYMKSLNRGIVPGFRRGGLVGTGNVRYRQSGSSAPESGGASLSVDSSNLQSVLTEFGSSFQSQIDNIIANFNSVNTAINNLASVISNGMTVTHQFSGDMKMAFSIENGDHLKNAIADAITPKLSDIIASEIDQRLNDFRAGG